MQISVFDPLSYSQEIAAVIATENSPSTTLIDAVLKNNSINVFKGKILEIPYSSKEIIVCLIQEIYKTNSYYSSADVLKQKDSHSSHKFDLFPVDEWATTFLTLHPLGAYSDSGIKRVQTPVNPGSKIYNAREEILNKFFGFSDVTCGINLGNLVSGDIPVVLNISKLLRKHLAILAISGAGKSYTTGVLLEEIMRRPKQIGRLPIIIIDPHGEYKYLVNENINKGSTPVTIFPGKYFTIASGSTNAWQIREFSPDFSSVQVRELDRIINTLKKSNSLNSFMDLILEIENNSYLNNRTRESLLGWLDSLQRLGVFGTVDFPIVNELLIPGNVSIIDLSDIHSLRKKQIICSHISRKSFELRRDKKVPPFLLIIEEAHQFCPEQEFSISKKIIETIAREGRKFFASLCLISQRPVKLSSTALSQCNSHLIMKIKIPYDLDYIGKLSEGIDHNTQKMLPDLDTGEAFLVGEAVRYPIMLKIREKQFTSSFYDSNTMENEILEFERD
jgi:DNA helicase HerA-like ATPase